MIHIKRTSLMSALVPASSSAALSGVPSRINVTPPRPRLERSGSTGTTSVCVGDLCVTMLKHCVVEVRPMADVEGVVVHRKGDVEWWKAVDACCSKDPRTQWPYSPLIVHMGMMADGRQCRSHYQWAKRFREKETVDSTVRLMLQNPKATLASYMNTIAPHFGERRQGDVDNRARVGRRAGRVRRA